MSEKLNLEVKAKWLAALRSGEYKQGRGFLQRDGKFCCLGVLCDLHDKETGGEGWKSNNSCVKSYQGAQYMAPLTVARWAGIEADLSRDSVYLWASLNDEGKTFAEIADIIEQEF